MNWTVLLPLSLFLTVSGSVYPSEKTNSNGHMELLSQQKLDESIRAYLHFLSTQKKIDTPAPPSEIYKNAFSIYLNPKGKPSQEIALEILTTYGPDSSDPYLAYLLAASYANSGRLDRFYPLFLQGYLNDPDHYLAEKMKAVLHIKIYERLLPGPEKEQEREQILTHLRNAQAKYSDDHMLYKMQIAFASDEAKPRQVEMTLQEMMDKTVIYPRVDLLFYVRMALAVENRPLAEKFLEYSKTLFGYSRSIEAAQRILDSKEL